MPDRLQSTFISAEAARSRMQQSLALTEFFVSLWSANPLLAHQAGRKVEEFMMTREEAQQRHARDLETGP